MTRSSRDLYDVIKLNEWKDQKDPLPCPIPQKRKKKSPESVEDHIQSFIHYVQSLFLSGHYENISKVLNYPFLWKLVPAENSETFALIRHQSIDFYTVKGDGSPSQSLTNSKRSKSSAKLGSQPKIERSANIKIESDANDGFKYQIGAWDDSSSLFVLVSSESKIRVFSSSGQFFSEYSLPGTTSADFIWDITHTACLVKFLSNEPTASKIAEFLVMSRSGLLHAFSINPTGNLHCSSSNNLDFTPYSPIVQAEYVESESYMLIISHKFHTAERDQEIPGKLSDIGILMFRSANKGCNFIATKTSVPAVESSRMLAKKLVICPFDNSRIAVLHENSCVSLWSLPEGEIVQFYSASDLPFYNEENPKINFHNQNNAKSVMVSDLHWWSEEILVLSRPNGCIFLMKFNQETSNLDLVLDQEGSKSLWLENNSLISPLFEHTSLILEPKRRTTGALDELDQVDEEIETNFLAWLKDKLLSFLFDAQHPAIEGPKSDTKYANFDYSLLKIKLTTPSELFRKKLDLCEWGEALEIANKFDGLDKDQVFQRRWQNSEKDHKNHVLDYSAFGEK